METTTVCELSLHNFVIVKPHPEYKISSWKNKNFKYEGNVKDIKYHYKNRSAKQFGKQKSIYIGFVDSMAYHNLLSQGSMIICSLQGSLENCYIINIEKNNNNIITTLEVAKFDDEEYAPYPLTYKITPENIESMLITDKAYKLTKL